MVKPQQPKGMKPKTELSPDVVDDVTESGLFTGKNILILNSLITLLTCFLFIGSNYFIVNGIVDKKVSQLMAPEHSTEEAGEEHGTKERGIILDLGDFILNLSDPSAKRYLKVNVALELSKAAHDPDLSGHAQKSSGGHGGGGEDPLKAMEREMNQYKPAIRDSIISILSSKTAEELSSLAGKELAKEQIKEAINPLFAGEREVLRVSFGTFIIQ